MALTVSMILQRTRSYLADVQSSGVSDSDFIDMLNGVMARYWLKLQRINPRLFTPSTATVGYVAGTQEYALPSNLGKLEVVEVTDLASYPVPLWEMDYNRKDDYPGDGEPFAYYVNGGVIGFVWTPARTATSNVKLTFVPDMTPVTYDAGGNYLSATPALPGELHDALPYAMAAAGRARDQLDGEEWLVNERQVWMSYLQGLMSGKGAGTPKVRYIP